MLKILEKDPIKRLTPKQALNHNWIVFNCENEIYFNILEKKESGLLNKKNQIDDKEKTLKRL